MAVLAVAALSVFLQGPIYIEPQAMKRAGLLVNPMSGKSSGKGLGLVAMLGSNAAVSARVLENFEQLPGILDGFARARVTDLFISSGDGRVRCHSNGTG